MLIVVVGDFHEAKLRGALLHHDCQLLRQCYRFRGDIRVSWPSDRTGHLASRAVHFRIHILEYHGRVLIVHIYQPDGTVTVIDAAYRNRFGHRVLPRVEVPLAGQAWIAAYLRALAPVCPVVAVDVVAKLALAVGIGEGGHVGAEVLIQLGRIQGAIGAQAVSAGLRGAEIHVAATETLGAVRVDPRHDQHLQIIQHLTGQGPARGKAFYQIDRRFGAVRFVAVLLGCDHCGWFV